MSESAREVEFYVQTRREWRGTIVHDIAAGPYDTVEEARAARDALLAEHPTAQVWRTEHFD